jgi:hypothetical protein
MAPASRDTGLTTPVLGPLHELLIPPDFDTRLLGEPVLETNQDYVYALPYWARRVASSENRWDVVTASCAYDAASLAQRVGFEKRILTYFENDPHLNELRIGGAEDSPPEPLMPPACELVGYRWGVERLVLHVFDRPQDHPHQWLADREVLDARIALDDDYAFIVGFEVAVHRVGTGAYSAIWSVTHGLDADRIHTYLRERNAPESIADQAADIVRVRRACQPESIVRLHSTHRGMQH